MERQFSSTSSQRIFLLDHDREDICFNVKIIEIATRVLFNAYTFGLMRKRSGMLKRFHLHVSLYWKELLTTTHKLEILESF